MSRIHCDEVVVAHSEPKVEDLRATFNLLCDQLESGQITNMDMTITTMGLDAGEITVASIIHSAQLGDSDTYHAPVISAISAQATGVVDNELFSSYKLLCESIRPTMYADDRAPNSNVAMLRMGASEYPVEMVPRGEVIPDGTDDEEEIEEDDEF
jgi:hypothetical protein